MSFDWTTPEIPHFPRSTAPGHQGHLSCGSVNGVHCLAMSGRSHAYEGTPRWQMAFPVRVMHRLGIRMLVISNAAGGVNPDYRVGDLMVIADHIDLMGTRSWTTEVDPDHAVRGAGLCSPYDSTLLDRVLSIARREDVVCHRGVYVALCGPNYETRAEYRMVRRIGGDVVGMSSVPEAVVAGRLGLRVLGLSIVTNVCLPDALAATAGEDVAAAAARAVNSLRKLVGGLIRDQASGI
jgi:purine-nucleoside phosphorylase